MIAPGVIRKALSQLSSLVGFPKEDEARSVVARLLQRHCNNETHLDALVDYLTSECDYWPGPATLRKVAAELVSDPTAGEYRVPAEWQREPGWKGFENQQDCQRRCAAGLLQLEGGGITACDCPRGRAITTKHIEALRYADKPPIEEIPRELAKKKAMSQKPWLH